MNKKALSLGLLILVAMLLVGGVLSASRDLLKAREGGSTSIDLSSLERRLLGLYLEVRRGEIEAPASDDSTPVLFSIAPGETAATIAVRLQEAGLIGDAQLFRLLVYYRGIDSQLEAGYYQLRPNMNMEEMVEALQHGQPEEALLTIPEGWRAEEIAELLEKRGLADAQEFMQLVREGRFNNDFLSSRPQGVSLEGYLFPDTYRIGQGLGAEEIVSLLLDNFGQRFTEEMGEEAAAQGLTIHQVVTLASLVEREAKIDQERPIIASVYLNRWRAGWLLESDATAQYALGYQEESGQWWKSPVTLEEMKAADSPYNTYLYPGLPPGPICNPGLASIQAVLEPAQTKYMFLYHKGDGSHAFAETYEEHLENQRRYEK